MESIFTYNEDNSINHSKIEYVECKECKLLFSKNEIDDHILCHQFLQEIKDNPDMTEEDITDKFMKCQQQSYNDHNLQLENNVIKSKVNEEDSFADKARSFFNKHKDTIPQKINEGLSALNNFGSKIIASIKTGIEDLVTDNSQPEINQDEMQEQNRINTMPLNNNNNTVSRINRYNQPNNSLLMVQIQDQVLYFHNNRNNNEHNIVDSFDYIDSNSNSNREELNYIINLLPITKLTQHDKVVKQKSQCIICLCQFEVGHKLTSLPCTHVFHNKCISKWLKETGECPICKLNITKENIFGNFDSNNL